jgi:PAS domain S-box-containing protein
MSDVKPQVVIVNDDPVQLGLMSEVIKLDGSNVLSFHNAEDALAQIAQPEKIDLIITDLHMPGIDGWRFCRLLRSPEFPHIRETPILVVSGTFSRHDVEMMTRDVGADAFLAMPYTPGELQETVHKLLHRRTVEMRPTVLAVVCHTPERRQIVDSFADHGYRVVEATGSEQALDLFHEHQPDVVVLDHCPPQIASTDLIPALKEAESDAAVIVITADRSPELAIALTRQGADAFIHKPFTTSDLVDLVTKVRRGQAMLHVENKLETMLAHALARQEQMEQRERELIALNKIGRVVTSSLTLEEMLTILRSQARQVIGAQVCSIALIDPSTQELVFWQADDPFAEELVGRRLKPRQGIAGQVAYTGQSVLVPDTSSDPRFYGGVDATTGFSTNEIVCAPLIARGKTIGVIELLNKRHGKFTEDDVRLVESVAAQTASAIEKARLYEATQQELAERIKAEEALQESKRRLQTFVDVTPDRIYLKDAELRYLLANRSFANYWHLEQDKIIGKTDFGFMSEEMANDSNRSDRQVLEEGRDVILESQHGGRVYETRKVPVLDDDGMTTGVAGIIRDVTDRKRLEEQLIRERKHEGILTLARGIAHDFNNALVGIVGNIDILRMDLPPDIEAEKTLQAMERSAQRMVALTNQLLSYAGGGRHPSQLVELNALVEETLRTLRPSIELDVNVQSDLAADLWQVEVAPDRLKQACLNLFTNALEAMDKEGGTLAICTENVQREAWSCTLRHPHPAGEYVHLSIADTGHGMDEEVRRRLFEPFFSTRFLGRGLGLAAALGIVHDHGGCIEIESERGAGTTVHVYLPRRTRLPQKHTEPEAEWRATILVVEDEPIVLNLVKRVLNRQGYTTICAEDGEHALRIYDQLRTEIDMVLLDLGLPGIGGETVLHTMRITNPDVRVLLTSGYNQDSILPNIELGDKTWFIQKPFSLQDLNEKIQTVINA